MDLKACSLVWEWSAWFESIIRLSDVATCWLHHSHAIKHDMTHQRSELERTSFRSTEDHHFLIRKCLCSSVTSYLYDLVCCDTFLSIFCGSCLSYCLVFTDVQCSSNWLGTYLLQVKDAILMYGNDGASLFVLDSSQLITDNLPAACRGHSLCADLVESASCALVNILLPQSPLRQVRMSCLVS